MEGRALHAAVAGEVDHDRLGEPVAPLDEAAHAARQRVRQHGHDGLGEIDGRAAQVRLLVEARALSHVVGDVGDVHGQAPAPVGPPLDPDRVVVVARGLGVDREREPAAEVRPPGGLLWPRLAGDARRLGLDVLRERGGQLVLCDDHLQVDAAVLDPAEHLDHPADGVARRRGRARHLDRDHRARLGGARLARRHEHLVQHPLVEGHDVPAELAVVLVAADDALVRTVEDADDPALGPLRPVALDARDDAVVVQRLADVRGGDVQVRLVRAAVLGDDEAVAGGAAREPADDEVHARGQADARPADVDDGAVLDQAAKRVLELSAPGGVERETAGQLADGHRLAEARQDVEHPVIDTDGVNRGFLLGVGMVPEVGLERRTRVRPSPTGPL